MYRTFTFANRWTGVSLHGMLGLLVIMLYGAILPAATSPPPAASGALARIENMTKVPGSNRGFPAEDYFTFHRSDVTKNSKGQTMKYANTAKMRIHNDGTGTLVITKLTTTNTANFRITGVSIPSGGLQIAPKAYRDVQVEFLTTGGETRRLITESLVMSSNADNASSVKATFRGAYMARVEGGSEINVQQVFEAFGFGTRMGVDNNGNLQVRPGSNYPSASSVNSGKEGDLILSGMFTQANPNKPVQTIQMSAFHGPGGAPTELRDEASARIVAEMKYNHGEQYHQTLLPKLTNTSTQQAGDFTAKTGQPFQILVAGHRTTGGTYENTRKDELLAVRVYKAKDRSGRVIPNEYIIIQDYIGQGCGAGTNNCDWNDNVSYIINARPLAVPTSKSISSLTVAPGETKVYPLADFFDRGYPGNKLTYGARLQGGGALPSWISIDRSTGTITVKAPESAAGQGYRIDVTATDYNNLRTTSTLSLTINGTPVPPPPPPTTETDSYWLEAECAQVGSRWTKESSGSASNGSYVVVKSGNSFSTPPADEAANRVRFVITDARAGSYRLFARIDARTGNDDSFWVRLNNGAWYKWFGGMEQGVGFVWNKLPGNALSLKEGTNTIDFAFREDGTRLDKVYLTSGSDTPTGMGSAAANCGAVDDATTFWLEAECGSLGSGWQSVSSSSASRSNYVVFGGDRRIDKPTSNEPSQQVTYTVNLSQSGTYHLFTRINAPDPGRNSLWVRIDNGNWVKFWEEIGGAQLLTSGFEWRKVNDDGNDISFNLSAGTHVIRVANREPGTRLDKLYLSRSRELPTGMGNAASNCTSALSGQSVASARPVGHSTLTVPTEVSLFPNPAVDRVTLQLTGTYTGRVLVILTDMTGRRISELTYEKQDDRWSTELDVSDLAVGLYHIRALAGDEQLVRPFVKR
ncbi:putative Ig domain-containing protein [Lewinella sp. JB7]|uniref:putative Ig domain-containing protein n=1 Tax=Lewinella sp. JB7 TaxID=2962887 RepID=UPI0020CA172B|nr:putative Ig domain-containing protein [Lewinella sp. JB7]MCP9236424.1 putative Ig domain-containing protein [Lewinella sp. JB7]